MIAIEGLTKRYGTKAVVEDVTVEIERGKITSFIGPNGAGKSTLLGMVSRLLAADTGEVLLEGRSVRGIQANEYAKRVSILTQSHAMNARLTVRELVSFGRFPHSRGRLKVEDERKVDEAIGFMNLTALETRWINELSGGQRQRAFIAMTIAQDTDYILLDEPLNSLDMKHSVEIMKTLRRLVEEFGKTIVVVLHDINFASVYSDRIVAMKDGRIIKDGPTEEIIQSDALREIYDMDIPIRRIDDCRICVYFNS